MLARFKAPSEKVKWFNIAEFLFLILLCEKIYNHTYISGVYNIYVILLMTVVSAFLLITKKCKLFRSDLPVLFLLIFIVAYGLSKESIRYGLAFFIVFVWEKIKIEEMDFIHKILIIIGLLFSIIDRILGYERVSGYMSGSGPVFSCTMLISIVYLLFKKERKKSDYLFILLASCLIFMSKTTSTFVLLIAIFLYKLAINIIYKFGIESRQVKCLIFGGIILAFLLLCFNFQLIMSVIPRSNRNASTSTRFDLYISFIKIWTSNIKSILLGRGGGYVQWYINRYWGVSSHLPLHQDLIMFACEYGLIGCCAIYKLFLKKYHMNFIIWFVLILGTFHNIILAPMTLCLLFMTSSSLNDQYDKNEILWR